MDANEQFAFPSPQPSDSDEVRTAIEQAGILWAEDPKESLKWLRKAAEIASDAGDDLRSVQLARVSADLRNLANISPSLPPTTLPPTTLPPPSAIAASYPASTLTSSVEPGNEASATSGESGDHTSSEPGGASDESEAAFGSSESSGSDPAVDGVDSPATEVTPNVPAVAAHAVASGFGQQSFGSGDASDAHVSGAPNEAPGLTPEQIAAFIPNMGFGKDPAQTVPATPAATAAAAALANGPSTYQPFGGFQSSGFGSPAPAPKSTPSAASSPYTTPGSTSRWQEPAQAPAPHDNSGKAMNTPAATPASKRPATLTNTPGVWNGGPRPEQPTLVGSPLNGLRAEDNFRGEAAVLDLTNPTRFVQHRAIAVAVSMTPNSSGHFDLHPLAEGELVEPGFRMALLVGLSADDRLFPGRG